jgi:hypothetical protein
MNAVKLQVVVPENRQLTLTLPPEVPPGEVEVIVLSRTMGEPSRGSWERIQQFLRNMPPAQPGRTKEEIDRYLTEERESWGDTE